MCLWTLRTLLPGKAPRQNPERLGICLCELEHSSEQQWGVPACRAPTALAMQTGCSPAPDIHHSWDRTIDCTLGHADGTAAAKPQLAWMGRHVMHSIKKKKKQILELPCMEGWQSQMLKHKQTKVQEPPSVYHIYSGAVSLWSLKQWNSMALLFLGEAAMNQ